jgi:hypothetical protein
MLLDAPTGQWPSFRTAIVWLWSRDRFLEEIRFGIAFLFENYGARPVPNSRGEGESGSETCAYIQANTLIFRFSKWRDEILEARVANCARLKDMYSLDDVLAAIKP